DQYQDDLIARLGPCRQVAHRFLDVRLGRLPFEKRLLRDRVFAEPENLGVGNTESLVRRVGERLRHRGERLDIPLLAAQSAHDHEMRLSAYRSSRETRNNRHPYQNPNWGQTPFREFEIGSDPI